MSGLQFDGVVLSVNQHGRDYDVRYDDGVLLAPQ